MVEPPKKTAIERAIEAAAREGVRIVVRPPRPRSGIMIVRLGGDAAPRAELPDESARKTDDDR
jgi:hypothetical protein